MVQKRLKLRDEQIFSNIHKFGNTTAASIPIALAEAIEKKLIHKNDIIIEVNTKLFDPRTNTGTGTSVESCIAQAEDGDTVVSDPKFKIRKPQRLTLKYFPIAKYFHIAIVLTQNRVDAYMDGKLAVTKVFNGNVVEPNTQAVSYTHLTLPTKA